MCVYTQFKNVLYALNIYRRLYATSHEDLLNFVRR
jgi:hypothetical protein